MMDETINNNLNPLGSIVDFMLEKSIESIPISCKERQCDKNVLEININT